MPNNLGYLPAKITGGSSLWVASANTAQDMADIKIPDFPATSGYSLEYQFATNPPTSYDADENDAGDGWTLEIDGSDTLTWNPGTVFYVGYLTETASGRVFAVDAGTITVDASPSRVSSWVSVLAAVDAAIATYAANPNGSISIDGMSVTYRSLDQLIALREYVLYRQQQDSASRPLRIIRARFT